MIIESLTKVLNGYGLISGFAVIGATMWVSYWISAKFTRGGQSRNNSDLRRAWPGLLFVCPPTNFY